MRIKRAVYVLRMILGDESESIWSDFQILTAMNMANQRIWRRLITKYPEQFATLIPSSHSGYAPTYAAGADFKNLQSSFEVIGGTTYTPVPLQILKLSYATSISGLDRPIDIPLVPLSVLEDHKSGSSLEYDIAMNYSSGQPRYKAAFSPTDTSLFIRPIPAVNLELRIYFTSTSANVFGQADLEGADDGPWLLVPGYAGHLGMAGGETISGAHPYNPSSGLSDAVVFDAAYILGFKDESNRTAFAEERERILATQVVPNTHQEAY